MKELNQKIIMDAIIAHENWLTDTSSGLKTNLILHDAKIDSIDFSERDLRQMAAMACIFQNCNFNFAVLSTANFGSCTFIGCTFKRSMMYHMQSVDNSFKECVFDGAKMMHNYLHGDIFDACSFFETDLSNSRIDSTNFNYSNFTNASLPENFQYTNDNIGNVFGREDLYKCISNLAIMIDDSHIPKERKINHVQLLQDLYMDIKEVLPGKFNSEGLTEDFEDISEIFENLQCIMNKEEEN